MRTQYIRWCMFIVLLGSVFFPQLNQAAPPTEKDTFEAYLLAFPDTKAIGVIYSEAKNDQSIKKIEDCAQEKNVVLIKMQASSIKDFPDALRQMKDKVDTLWVPSDALYSISESWNFFIMFCLRNRIKTVVLNEKALAGGGLFFLTENSEIIINKRILDVLGLKVSDKAGTVKYYGGE